MLKNLSCLILACTLLTNIAKAQPVPICTSTEIIHQPSLFSFPVTKMAQGINFDDEFLYRRPHYNTCPPYCERYGTWAQAYWGHLRQGESECNLTPDPCHREHNHYIPRAGYGATGRGLIIGVDRRFDPHFRAGFAYAYSTEKAGTDVGGNLKINSQQGLIFGRYQFCSIYCSGIASFALNIYRQNDDANTDLIDDFTGWQFNGKLETGYQFHRACGSYLYHATPHFLFNYGHLSTHAYQRDNGLSIHNEPVDAAQLGVGVYLSYDYRSGQLFYPYQCLKKWGPRFDCYLRNMNFCFYNSLLHMKYQYTPYVRLVLTKDIFKETQETFAHLSGDDTDGCVFRNAPPFNHGYIAGLGIALDFKNNSFLSLEYDYEAKSGYNLQTAFIKYRFEWC